MLQRFGEGLYSHIFLGNWRNAAESNAGARPNDSNCCRRIPTFIDTSRIISLDATICTFAASTNRINGEKALIVPTRAGLSANVLVGVRLGETVYADGTKISVDYQ
jgi:hypothetical protein